MWAGPEQDHAGRYLAAHDSSKLFLYPKRAATANPRASGKGLDNRKGTAVQFRVCEEIVRFSHTLTRRYGAMRRDTASIGRKVPRSSFERDRRTILKLVPKLRKIKPAKGR
jgi:hypothetical protein